MRKQSGANMMNQTRKSNAGGALLNLHFKNLANGGQPTVKFRRNNNNQLNITTIGGNNNLGYP